MDWQRCPNLYGMRVKPYCHTCRPSTLPTDSTSSASLCRCRISRVGTSTTVPSTVYCPWRIGTYIGGATRHPNIQPKNHPDTQSIMNWGRLFVAQTRAGTRKNLMHTLPGCHRTGNACTTRRLQARWNHYHQTCSLTPYGIIYTINHWA